MDHLSPLTRRVTSPIMMQIDAHRNDIFKYLSMFTIGDSEVSHNFNYPKVHLIFPTAGDHIYSYLG
jgi:hypothetical protein